ncbi:response regulator transcription factor [Stenotrophomonas sp.]|uniref:response regulator transcription factor n=1 Tax=Stenotrophomonas sp. TaxID=69392 RepID=UPI0028A8A442|nr:response regulator transcription factor [Stenotrophomonas sp.]
MGLLELHPACHLFRKVVVADDHAMVAQGIRYLLQSSTSEIDVVTSGEELLQAIRTDLPDVVVADIGMPGISGIDAMVAARKEGINVPFLFLTMHDDVSMALTAMRAGANGYVVKNVAGEELVQALLEIARGGTYISQTLAARVLCSSNPREYVITSKQQRILEYLALGLRPQEIALELGVSPRTVESHKYALMQELEVHSTLQLLLKAKAEGFI